MSARDEAMKHEAKRIVELIRGGSIGGFPIDDGVIGIVDLDDINTAKFICAIYYRSRIEEMTKEQSGCYDQT